ncbi:hypothetical protein [Tuwongella immobilis]|uniref:Uncharacterized protein n=1 Tax=Tuwongella immobilis TaxID=692036 RepID=A0A6C2YXN1_9BACT|nr:hypothetical protein [Tuwongella immobilis]VIP05562.1 unnamed protein product [Tuwongella immobilis]VTS08480.1 unnamed protein product [Tuwongella immobilis]
MVPQHVRFLVMGLVAGGLTVGLSLRPWTVASPVPPIVTANVATPTAVLPVDNTAEKPRFPTILEAMQPRTAPMPTPIPSPMLTGVSEVPSTVLPQPMAAPMQPMPAPMRPPTSPMPKVLESVTPQSSGAVVGPADRIPPQTIPENPRNRGKLPVMGRFIKEVDVSPYGSGKVTLDFSPDGTVTSHMTGNVLGVEFSLTTEAEVSISKHGVIYGVVTDVQLGTIKPGALAAEAAGELQLYMQLLKAAEPLINDVMVDMPFSYHLRTQGDRLMISQFRVMLAGPNPLGKFGALGMGDEAAVLGYFQAINIALEGTYRSSAAVGASAESAPMPGRTMPMLFNR